MKTAIWCVGLVLVALGLLRLFFNVQTTVLGTTTNCGTPLAYLNHVAARQDICGGLHDAVIEAFAAMLAGLALIVGSVVAMELEDR